MPQESKDNKGYIPERKVINTEDTPEYINLATHYSTSSSKVRPTSDKIESIKFTDNSINFIEPIEDEELLSGKVKPVVRVSSKPAVTVDPLCKGSNMTAISPAPAPVAQSDDSMAAFDYTSGNDIAIDSGSICDSDDLVDNFEVNAEEGGEVVSSHSPFDDISILMAFTFFLVLFIVIEIFGMVYLF